MQLMVSTCADVLLQVGGGRNNVIVPGSVIPPVVLQSDTSNRPWVSVVV